ncbi:myb-related protein MYBAS1-like isoform X1 [Zingiber officinale]|uniref:Uncharacterized protein n=1 Tax=Zingiber officinale TaxID=94328 RepID=A0A8J5G5K3_ZINOF|nr:myb-related protein MYBAS1-like isoform X1 [Zingiber officinale]KAG6498817.1 hypothetical protein ZIOFF_038566 [Zingiber officinale]
MVVVKEETRRGPWSEHEDRQLLSFVRMLGDRRWDLIAKVSGLNRTGKSCRLRWVNYLNPDLKRGRLTPQEKLLVLQLHSLLGNRWSKIARKLPGRTDNEIKNYWRAHMRKISKECKRGSSLGTSLVCDSLSLISETPPQSISNLAEENGVDGVKCYSMDLIWDEIESSAGGFGRGMDGACDISCSLVPSLSKDVSEPQWKIDEDELRMSLLDDARSFFSNFHNDTEAWFFNQT